MIVVLINTLLIRAYYYYFTADIYPASYWTKAYLLSAIIGVGIELMKLRQAINKKKEVKEC